MTATTGSTAGEQPFSDGASRSRRLAASQTPLVVGFVLLLAVAASLIFLVAGGDRFADMVARTLQVRSTAYRLLTLVQDAETGERGYLLTGNELYLRPYATGRTEAPRAFDALQALLAGNRAQADSIDRLRTAIGAKMRDLALTTDLKRQGKGDEALAHVRLNIGNSLMEQVRRQVAAIEDEEVRAQDKQNAAVEFYNRLLVAASLLGLVVVFGLAAYTIGSMRRANSGLIRAQGDLRRTNENLEGIVSERVSDLQMANEEIQRFAYIVSHDLRAPLVNVMGFTSELDAMRGEVTSFLRDVERIAPQIVTADRKAAIETDLPEALGFIRTSTSKMDRLINAILKLSREGRRVLTPQPIEIRELVEAQGKSLFQQLAAGDAELVVQEDLPDITSDRLAVEQIFGNIIENAAKYLASGRRGRITVTGRASGTVVSYEVADNGRGISDKDFERIFELFRRSGEQDKPGEGIGLAYVRNLARRLGGNVTVQSKLGAGSTFTITLPSIYQAKARPTP